jgi:hypothetical protein
MAAFTRSGARKASEIGGLVVGALSDSVVFLANRPNR